MEITKKTQKILIGHAPMHYKNKPEKDVIRTELSLKGDVEKGKHHYLVLRPKSAELAEKSAIVCEYCCEELNNIHYSQGSRHILWEYLTESESNANKITIKDDINNIKRKLLSISGIDVTLYVDCSSFVATCAKIGGAWNALSGLPTTSSAETAYIASGLYEAFTSDKYTKSLDYLKRGDILIAREEKGCTYSHATMVLGDGELAPLDRSISSTSSVKTNPTINISQVTGKSIVVKTTVEDIELLELYDWKFSISSPCAGVTIPNELKVNFKKENIITPLDPNTLYFLKIIGINKKDSTHIIGTANVAFRTEPERPSSISNLVIKQVNKNIPVEKILINFNTPTAWPSVAKDKFYRISLAIGGNTIGYFDKEITGSLTNILEILSLSKFYVEANSQIQIGVQVGYNQISPIFDSNIPTWSNIITVESNLKLIDKLFIQVKNTFNRLILSIPNVKKR